MIEFQERNHLFTRRIQAKHLKFAKEYISKNNAFWEVIFSDENKFNIFRSNGRRYFQRKSNSEMNVQNFRPTVKHDGAGVML